MAKRDAGSWLAELTEPLVSKFGDRLIVRRYGGAVRWCYDGRSALVELLADGRLDATFLDLPTVDRISRSLAAPLYRPSGRGYTLSAEGCNRMAADLVDFFTGVREPHFTFVGTSGAHASSNAAGPCR